MTPDGASGQICLLQACRVDLFFGEDDLKRQCLGSIIRPATHPSKLQFQLVIFTSAASLEDDVCGSIGIPVFRQVFLHTFKSQSHGEMIGVAGLRMPLDKLWLSDHSGDD